MAAKSAVSAGIAGSRAGRSASTTPPRGGIPENPEPAPVSSRRKGVGNGRQKAMMSPRLLPTLIIAETPRLRRFAAAMIGDEGAADHLVQETLTEAFAQLATLQAQHHLGVSLMTILYRRRRQATEQLDQLSPSPMTASFEAVLLQWLPGADRDEIQEFAGAIGSLAEEDRAMLLLVALENLGYRDIAAVVEIPLGRVMSRIARARAQLQQALKAAAPEAQNGSYRGETA